MLEIPPVKSTDTEDVVWGLQTADTLWKRGERIDALVWLRRAAQAAGDANDDDRALELARLAAELTDAVASDEDGVEVNVSLPPRQAEPTIADSPSAMRIPVPAVPPSEQGRPDVPSVLPAETVHAGMFDPWAEGRPGGATAEAPTAQVQRSPSIVDLAEDEEVITSVKPMSISHPELGSSPPAAEAVAAPPPAPRPPAVPPKAPPPVPRKPPPPLPKRAAAPPAEAPTAPPPQPDTAPPPAELVTAAPPPKVESAAPPPKVVTAPPPPKVVTAPPPPKVESAPALDLEQVDAFADLPDDARAAFAAAATLHPLKEGEEIGAFALAYVLSGAFDVAATVVDAPAVRLQQGAVLRARGTTEENVPLRLICASGSSVVATWSDAAVDEAFRTIPWVEEDLRAAGDRVQTLVGITIGPLGERLDPSIREEIIGRLTMRPLTPGEIVVAEGQPVPGLLLVGIGELELVKGGAVVGTVSSGDFLFPTEVLGAGSSPSTARAGAGGALVMFGDRKIAQELLVTCPPLLEVFAGM